ncbi:pilus assembly protein [Anaerobacillus alkaliphilus]|uniref:Pilus assembly protein n=1 Tax=Anaerobacillus alkaliphilus TaxID=1548597 RepID=A0A4Q0VWJ5_9BACI|nr:TadE family protein [Anaerobacillus alkaliphilus]RXJ01904.1 pilus assembly protein [Anaerobacillus alkaliphilus]
MKSEDGQALVEFALVFMLLMLLLCGIVDFGRAFHAYLALDHAGREAARIASIGENDVKVRDAAKAAVRHLSINDTNISIIPAANIRKQGDFATVTLTYDLEFITPLIGRLFTDNLLSIESRTVMRVE